MIDITWNDLPFDVRMHLVAHYLPLLETKTKTNFSIVESISKDFDIEITTEFRPLAIMHFTEPQYTWFLLRWS